MTSIPRPLSIKIASLPLKAEGPFVHQSGPLANEELKDVLQGLAIPFDLVLVQWRVTEWSDDGQHGLMLPYADPRAYSDRLNDLFTPMYPRRCALCGFEIESVRDLDWHGYGNCVEIT